MNNVLNSDSECPESKLGRVHQVHTLAQPVLTGRPHYAQAGRVAVVSWRARCRIAGPPPAVSQACPVVSQRLHGHVVACPATQPNSQTSSCHDIIACIVTRLANQTPFLSRYKDCIVTQPSAARPLSPVMIQNLYRDTHPQPGRARALLDVSQASWPCRSLAMAVSWPATSCHGAPLCAASQPCLSQYSLLYSDSNLEKNWAVAQPATYNSVFFFHLFFSHSSYWKTTQKKYFFFHFLVNQINLLKFILFIFFNFYTL